MKFRRTSTMMQLAKKGVCVLSWINFGKNADALFGQLNKRAMQISITKMSHFALVKKPMLKKCKTQKCRTGHGENGALLCWSAGCKLPPATLEKCMLYLKTSKKQSYRTYSTSPHGRISWENQKIDKTQAPQSLGLLYLEIPRFGYNLHVLGRKKWRKKMWYLCTIECYSAIKSMK